MNRNSITNTMDGISYTYRKSPSGDRITVTRNGNTETFYSNDYVQEMIDKHMQRHGNSFSVLKHAYEDKITALQEVLDKVDRVCAVDRRQFADAVLSWYIQTITNPTIKADTADAMARLAVSAFLQNQPSLAKIAK